MNDFPEMAFATGFVFGVLAHPEHAELLRTIRRGSGDAADLRLAFLWCGGFELVDEQERMLSLEEVDWLFVADCLADLDGRRNQETSPIDDSPLSR